MRRMFSENQIKELFKNTRGYNFANLVDKDGHDRFIEGDITFNEISGVTQKYGKWSLSGSHLLIVFAGEIADETVITSGNSLATIDLPSWIKSKIVAIFGDNVIRSSTSLWADNYTQQTWNLNLIKQGNNISIQMGGITLTAKRNFRMNFDLLIDNE